MFPDAKWLDAFKLPFKANLGIALACGALWYLFAAKVLSLGQLDTYIVPGLVIALVVFAIFVVVEVAEWIAKPWTTKRQATLLSSRREVRAKEREKERDETRQVILARLDHLSREEIRYVAEALEKGSSTFYTYAYAGPVGALITKALVWNTGGTHNQDHYPFTFADFVWEELVRRRDEFLAKEAKFKEEETAKKRSGGRF